MTSASKERKQFQTVLGARFSSGKDDDDDDDELKKHINKRLENNHFVNRPRFEYRQLSLKSHIRLAILIPGKIEDEIYCMLKEVDPSAYQNEYLALSYACGDPTKTLPVVCNGCQTQIPLNLYSFLLRVRHCEHAMLIWIDALCINQASSKQALGERASQIRLMGKIFSGAKLVVVDLGGANANRSQSLAWVIKQLGAGGACDPLTVATSANSIIQQIKHGPKAWDLYIELIKRPWFRRVWVVQEFVLAKQVRLMYGMFHIRSSDLLAAAQQMASVLYETVEKMTSEKKAYKAALKQLRDATWSGPALEAFTWLLNIRSQLPNRPALVTVLNFSRARLTTDVRDHVYAIMALVKESDLSDFEVNYDESESDLTSRLAKKLARMGLGEYCLARSTGIDSGQQRYPSWAPPLYHKNLFRSQGLMELNNPSVHFPPIYRAGGSTRSPLIFESDGEVMVIRGARIDEVKHYTSPMLGILNDIAELPSPLDDNTRHIVDWFQIAIQWARLYFSNWTESRLQQSLKKTVVLDATGHDERFDTPARLPVDSSPSLTTNSFWGGMKNKSHKRKVCRTIRGRMALIPQDSQRGDEIWVFLGISVPFVLRRYDGFHRVVGPCYVHDVMDGQALQLPGSTIETVRLR